MSNKAGRQDYPTDLSLLNKLNAQGTMIRASAWEQFRKFYAPIIAGFARNMGARPQDVDDVIQDVMLGFFSASSTFKYDRARGRFRGYLKTCTFHSLKRIAGRTARLKTTPLQDVDPDSLELDRAWQENWEREQLQVALQQLKEEFPTSRKLKAFELHAIEGKSAEEVAQELKMTVAAVYKSKQRATEELKERIRVLEEGSGLV